MAETAFVRDAIAAPTPAQGPQEVKRSQDWSADNQRHLRLCLDALRLYFDAPAAERSPEWETNLRDTQAEAATLAGRMSDPPALQALAAAFSLSPFERDLLLLAAGAELDSRFRELFMEPRDGAGGQRVNLTFSRALAALPGAHWSALTPESSLRRWRLIELAPGDGLMFSPLRIDERVLHFLLGIHYLDDRLSGLIAREPGLPDLAPSHARLADRIAALWQASRGNGLPPIAQLIGPEAAHKRSVASAASRSLGCDLFSLPATHLPADARELEALLRLWEREAVLSHRVLLLECDELDASDAARQQAVTRFTEGLAGWLMLSAREPRPGRSRPVLNVDVAQPPMSEARGQWRSALGPLADRLNGQVDRVAEQFQINSSGILAVAAQLPPMSADGADDGDLGARLWDACRSQCRTRLDELARRIDTPVMWTDLVLPPLQLQVLRELAGQVRQRERVYREWGFAGGGSRGLGISALFAGASGTGKTLAAEVLANELRLDLYRIDLSQVVSKYIGETEKNLRRVFDAAERGGAVLLFDEADALFGKRSEVKDSHDRYANIEVSYLLQRMEAYRGLAILTTNLKSSLDSAFLRRIRFIVDFPFPDAGQRAEIWRRMFPPAAPTEGLDVARMARLNVAGGNIRNIALNAAFLAADAQQPIRMSHVLRAAQIEYAKLDKHLPAGEVNDWN